MPSWVYLLILVVAWLSYGFLDAEIKRYGKQEETKRRKREQINKVTSYYELRQKITEQMAAGRREAEKLRKEGYGFGPTPEERKTSADYYRAGEYGHLPGDTAEKMKARPLPSDFMPGGSRHGEPLNVPTMIITNTKPSDMDPSTLKMIRETGAIVLPGITSLEQLGDAFLAHEDTLKARHKAKKKAPKKKR